MRLQRCHLVVVAFCVAGCVHDGRSDEGTGSDEVSIGRVGSALGDEDKNDYRNRKTDNKLLIKRKEDCTNDPRVALGLVSVNICVGADLFFREPFGGNGRACGSCHTAQFDFTISPEFIASLAPDDPLFVAEHNPALMGLERPELMRELGLILENVDGAEAPTTKFVMRAVPHTFSLATSIGVEKLPEGVSVGADGTTQPPLQRTGWSGDGAPAPGGLKQFQVGAIFQHYTKSLARVAGTDFTEANDEQLSRIEDFLRGIGRTSEISIANRDMALVDPGAEAGRYKFLTVGCNACHRNAGANSDPGTPSDPTDDFNRNFDTGVELAHLEARDMMGIPRDGGFGGPAPGTPFEFNHDTDRDGTLDSYGNGKFNSTPLIEAADTGPFFHNNAVDTLEEAIHFYTTPAFAAGRAGPLVLSETDITNIGKFLRVLNANFNCKLAIKRLDAAVQVTEAQKNHFKGLQFGLLDAAQAEVRDALADLSQVGIHPAEQARLIVADQAITDAFSNASFAQRKAKAQTALTEVIAVEAAFGTGMGYQVGPGSIMF